MSARKRLCIGVLAAALGAASPAAGQGKSCPLIAGAGCAPGFAKSGTDINGTGVDDDGDGAVDELDERDWFLREFEDDKGNKIQIWCVDGPVPYYAMIFLPAAGGPKRFIGQCPFERGCNEKWKLDDTDGDGNGKPDCFTKTVWISRDEQYGDLDDDGDGLDDWYKFTYDVKTDMLWAECWESADGEGDGDGNGADAPDVKTAESHKKAPQGNFDFDTIIPMPPPTPGDTPMEGSKGKHKVHGVGAGGTYRLDFANDFILVSTSPGSTPDIIAADLASAFNIHPVWSAKGFLATPLADDVVVEECADGDLFASTTDPGLFVPGPVQNLVGSFDGAKVTLLWNLGDAYERIHVYRDGVPLAVNLLGSTTLVCDVIDFSIDTDDKHEYRVMGEQNGARSAASIVVDTPNLCSQVYCDTNPANAADITLDTCACSSGSIHVSMQNGPPNQFGYLLIGSGNGTVTNPPGAIGDLCLIGAQIGRYNKDAGLTDGGGGLTTDLLNAISGGGGGNIPNPPGGNVCNPPGQSWNFQYWHRDGMNPSRFSKALRVAFL